MSPQRQVPKPGNPLNEVKKLIRANDIAINGNAIQTAWDDFRWDSEDIKKCLLKLNDRYHNDDPLRNHFYKQEQHTIIPHAIMDYYKANSIMDGQNVYTHFYVHPSLVKVVISSFKRK